MSEPLVSISCITYNHSKFIRKCLDGFLMQKTNFSFEILIHDDASTDGTQDIISEYQKSYPKIIKPIFQKENQYSKGVSISATFNWPRVKGKYIAMCEGDDYWTDPVKLQKQVDFLETNQKFSGCFHETPEMKDGHYSGKIFGRNVADIVYAEDTISLYSPFHTSSFAFRRSALQIPEWLTKVFSGDMALFSVIVKSGPLKKIPGQMSVYRKHKNGITVLNDNTLDFFDERIKLTRYLDEFHDYKYHEKAKSIIDQFEKMREDFAKNELKTHIGLLGKIGTIFKKYFH